MLEGKEVEGKIGDVGSYELDVDDKGKVKITATISKDLGHTKISSANSVETDIFAIAQLIAVQTKTELDDKAIAALKGLLGISSEVQV